MAPFAISGHAFPLAYRRCVPRGDLSRCSNGMQKATTRSLVDGLLKLNSHVEIKPLASRSHRVFEKLSRFLQVGSIQSLRKPRINRPDKMYSFLHSPLSLPQAYKPERRS